jgi:hypothetical protein
MRVLRYAIGLFILVNLAGCCGGFRQIKTTEGVFACPECCPMIKYSGTSITVKGVNLPIPNAPLPIGEVSVEPKVIQQASEVVQILEQHRLSTCHLLISHASVSKAAFAKALEAMQNDETALTQFALIVSTKDGAAIQKFLDFYLLQTQRLKAAEIEPPIKAYKYEVRQVSARSSAEPKYTVTEMSAKSSVEFEEFTSIEVAPLSKLLK